MKAISAKMIFLSGWKVVGREVVLNLYGLSVVGPCAGGLSSSGGVGRLPESALKVLVALSLYVGSSSSWAIGGAAGPRRQCGQSLGEGMPGALVWVWVQ